MSQKEWAIDLALLIVGAIITIESLRLGVGEIHHPSAGFLPFFTGAGLSLAAAFALVKNVLIKRRKGDEEGKVGNQSFVFAAIIIVALGLYVVILPWLGYLVSTFILFLILFKTTGFRKWSFIVLASFLTVLSSYLVFAYGLNMRFPKGLLGF